MSKMDKNFGALFYHDDYYQDTRLLREALIEMAYCSGHTWENPISMSLLCMEFMMSYDTAKLIQADISAIIASDSEELRYLSQIRAIMTKHFPYAHDLEDRYVRGFVKAMAKCWLSELMSYVEIFSLEEKNL
ncbi:MAG: hypothetical protein FWG65_08450 [Turicibacter sp.]|nr:hypothetical protein [Turicibacter sp.]